MKDTSSKKSSPKRKSPDKGDAEKPGRSRKHDRVPLILITIVVLAHLVFFLPFHGVTSDIPEIDDISTKEVIAPFNFPILKSDEELARESMTVRMNVPVILDFNAEVGDSALKVFDSLWESALPFIEKKGIPGRVDSVRVFFPWISEEDAKTLSEFRVVSNVRQNVREILTEVYSTGVFDWKSMPVGDTAHLFNIRRGREEDIIPSGRVLTLEDAIQRLKERSLERFSEYPEKGMVTFEIARGLMAPNLIPEIELTQANRQRAVENVKPIRGRVLKDQRIVDAHERITEEIHQKLVSLAIAKSGRYSTTPSVYNAFRVVGRLFLTLLLIVIFSYYVRNYFNDIWTDTSKFAVVLFSIWLPGLFGFIFRITNWPELLIPIAFSATLIAVLFGSQLGIVVVVTSTMILAVAGGSSVSSMIILLIEGIVAAEMFSHLAQRRQSIRPIAYTLVASVIAVIILDFMSFVEFGKMWPKALSVSAGSIFGPLLAIALIPVFEKIVGVVTDFTLVEFANTNAPVLQQLAIEAPGTYHHSMVVGTLAERAAEATGANALLAKVGGLYHDIGKLTHPEYFSENLSDENPHDKLSPHMSFLVLSAHVKEGIRLGRIHDIPEAIIDIVRQHHGDAAMRFFYEQAKVGDPSVTEDAFRYPGPKPQTREAAIIMLADSVEAKIRSMNKVDVSQLTKIIKDTIDDKFETGQLSETDITTKDLNLITKSFATIMEGVLHRRPNLENREIKPLDGGIFDED